ncbi:MAG: FG-GAP-like repeat-containing protein [Acidobacteria bacterium]|nr:FG-GAP-like repeat-containing protein [Acidobacteriota bacterium]MCA1636867.1 FG-GAP-like repeat-containing protein [Acidobacteriota bacterium]
MNWKFKLTLVGLVVLAVAIFVKLPSQAENNEPVSSKNYDEAAQETVTKVGDLSVVKPSAVGVSGKVRDMPTSVSDAKLRGVFNITKHQKRELMLEEEAQAKGITKEELVEEINKQNKEEIKKIIPGKGVGENFKDSLMGKSVFTNAPQAMPTPDLTFDGNANSDNFQVGAGGRVPPDTIGDVGPNHYVQAVNLVFSVFNKSTGARIMGPTKLDNLFSSLPAGSPCQRNDGDPTVNYDQLADRWILTYFAQPTAGYYQCVAVSQTPDPTGAYYLYQYLYPNSVFNDFPKFGVWRDAYYMSVNEFADDDGGDFVSAGMVALDRDKMLLGNPNATLIVKRVPTSGGLLPTDIDGFGGPPTELDHIFLEFRANEYDDPFDGLRAFRFRPDFDNPANTIFQVLDDVPLAEFDARNPEGQLDVEQAGGQNLHSPDGNLMHRLCYRNLGTQANPINSYVGSFVVNTSGLDPTTSASKYDAGIRWFELRRTANSNISVFDQGTHADATGTPGLRLNNWMGSIGQDNRGDLALGYSQAGPNQNADIKIAGRTNNVANSGILNEGEALFHDAAGSQTVFDRWGDYSSMNLDSDDDCTFWYTQEYYATKSQGGWSTRIGKFKFPQCTPATKATITGTVTSCSTGAAISGALVDSTGGFVRVSSADGTYSMTVAPGTYNVTASKLNGFPATFQTVTLSGGQTATVNICLTGVPFVAQGGDVQIVSENCGTPNGAPEPGETISITLPLQNTGAANTTNLTATLQATGGVTNVSSAQNYGAIVPGGAAQSRTFNFTVDSSVPCGSPITLTFNLTDGSTNYGTVTKTFTTGARAVTFSENFDGVTAPALPAGWTTVQLAGTANSWVTSTTKPSSPPNAAFAGDLETVSSSALVSPLIPIPGSNVQMSFKNFYNTEATFDGMVLEYTNDGGASWTDIIAGGGSFENGGYNTTIDTESFNPIKGRRAWSGNSNGYIDTVVNLPASLNGQSVQFRWVMASDESKDGEGVRIDDVQIFGRQCNKACAVNCNFQRRFDFDGDAKADISVFRPDNGVWYLLKSQSGFSFAQFGISTDKIVPADYDGDGKTDLAVYRSGTWYLQRSTAGFIGVAFGAPDDIPQPADFDGDGKADLAVFRPSNGTWYVYNLIANHTTAVQFGQNGDKPVVGDYDGDCKADYAVYRNGTWYLLRSTEGFTGVSFGEANDKSVPADYDGDGKTDIAVFRPSNGTWYLQRSTAGFTGIAFGLGSDLPVPGDYDGDGKADVAVFRLSNGFWYLQRSTAGFTGVQFGAASDKPAPNAYVQ